jgi:hypothetical protein
VGAYTHGRGERTLIAHWNGTAWKQVPSPNPSSLYSTLSGQGYPTVRFSGVTVDQVLTHYQRVDGYRSALVVATGCRRCRHRCRQLPHEDFEAGRSKVLRIAFRGRETRVGTLDEPDTCHPLRGCGGIPS